MLYRIIAMHMLEFIIQDFQLRIYLLQCRTINQGDFLPAVHLVLIIYYIFHLLHQFHPQFNFFTMLLYHRFAVNMESLQKINKNRILLPFPFLSAKL